jgi:hypothetical protein
MMITGVPRLETPKRGSVIIIFIIIVTRDNFYKFKKFNIGIGQFYAFTVLFCQIKLILQLLSYFLYGKLHCTQYLLAQIKMTQKF